MSTAFQTVTANGTTAGGWGHFSTDVAVVLKSRSTNTDLVWFGYSSSIGVDGAGGSIPLFPGETTPVISLLANTYLYVCSLAGSTVQMDAYITS